jgi:hypothetical protein
MWLFRRVEQTAPDGLARLILMRDDFGGSPANGCFG